MEFLNIEIENLRKEMIELGQEKGLHHKETIEVSKLLDRLLLSVQFNQKTTSNHPVRTDMTLEMATVNA